MRVQGMLNDIVESQYIPSSFQPPPPRADQPVD